MSEIAFTKSFLSALDARPIKVRSDHVFDQGETPRVSYILPRLPPRHPSMPKPSNKSASSTAPGSSKSITITLKSARSPVLNITIPGAPLSTTTISDLKDSVRERIADTNSGGKVPLEKIKILFKRKPVTGNGKTVKEVIADTGDEGVELLSGGKEVEFGVMVMGGAKVVEADGDETSQSERGEEGGGVPLGGSGSVVGGQTTAKAAVGPSGDEVLQTEGFWDDLQGYLEQRLKDEDVARRLRGVFKEAWSANK
ncbi:cell-cycle control medial ring component [Aspergillus crustosus]